MGIVFYRTAAMASVLAFYTERVGCRVHLDQPDCTVLDHGGFRVGFCAGDEPEIGGTLTFVHPHRDGVDAAYDRLADCADDPPRENERYRIYQFFATDPEGRTVEVQTFE
ncbi:MAG: VOC family protein [Halobacteriaceae archaeon]